MANYQFVVANEDDIRIEIDGHLLEFCLCDDDDENVTKYQSGETDSWNGMYFTVTKFEDNYTVKYGTSCDVNLTVRIQRNALNDSKMDEVAKAWLNRFRAINGVDDC